MHAWWMSPEYERAALDSHLLQPGGLANTTCCAAAEMRVDATFVLLAAVTYGGVPCALSV